MRFRFTRKWHDALPSTHEYVKKSREDADEWEVILARCQESGRGQRGNSWESEPGKNLTFTFRYRPEGIAPREQFAISEAVSLSIVEMLKGYGIEAKVKWPNDIYMGDSKICGILIDHAVSGSGRIDNTVVSAGVNVNQREFRSDAPNPVSMWQIKQQEADLDEVMTRIEEALAAKLPMSESEEGRAQLHREYMARLWHNDGKEHCYTIAADGRNLRGRIQSVAGNGLLKIDFGEEGMMTFAFKEIIQH